MAEAALKVELSAPERDKVSLDAAEVVVPGADGLFTVLPGHTPLLSTLDPGVLVIYDAEGQEQCFALACGFAEVRNDRVSILTEAFEPGMEIDLDRAKVAEERAEERLRRPAADVDVERAELALRRSLARQQAHSGKFF